MNDVAMLRVGHTKMHETLIKFPISLFILDVIDIFNTSDASKPTLSQFCLTNLMLYIFYLCCGPCTWSLELKFPTDFCTYKTSLKYHTHFSGFYICDPYNNYFNPQWSLGALRKRQSFNRFESWASKHVNSWSLHLVWRSCTATVLTLPVDCKVQPFL